MMRLVLSSACLVLGFVMVAQAQEGPQKIAIGLDAIANDVYQAKQAKAKVPAAPIKAKGQTPEPAIVPVKGKVVQPQPVVPKTHIYFRPNWGGRDGWDSDYYNASTAAEGYLSGIGRLHRGQARFLEGLGQYQNMHQEARTKAIKNWQYGVETWLYLKDQRREREYGRDWIDNETHRLDQAERRFALRQRRQALIQQGILPQPKQPSCVIRGRRYPTVADWKKTADHVLHRLEVEEKNLIHLGPLTVQQQDVLVDIRIKQKMVQEFISIKGNLIVDPTGGQK